MDLAEQFAAVWARRAVVLVVAFLAAAGVFAWRSAAPEVFESTSTVQVRVPDTESSDPSVQVDYYAQTVTGLATTRSVVAAAMEAAGRTDAVGDVVDQITAEPSEQPGFVTITGAGDSPTQATELTDALVTAVTQQVAEDQAEDQAAERDALVAAIAQVGREREALPASDYAGRAALIRERESLLSTLRASSGRTAWQVGVVEPARPPSSPSAPQPVRDALLAFLLAVILVAEWIVVRRAWRGAVATRRPGRDVSEILGIPAVEVGSDDPPSVLATLLPLLDEATQVTVIQRGPRASAHSASLLAELLASRGQEVLLVDATPDRAVVHLEMGVGLEPGLTSLPIDDEAATAAVAALPTARRLHVLAAGRDDEIETTGRVARLATLAPVSVVVVAASSERLDDLVALVSEVDGPVVVDLDPRHATRRELEAEVAALRGLGADVVAATVHVGSMAEAQHLAARRRRGLTFQQDVAASSGRKQRAAGSSGRKPAGPDAADRPGTADQPDRAGRSERSGRPGRNARPAARGGPAGGAEGAGPPGKPARPSRPAQPGQGR